MNELDDLLKTLRSEEPHPDDIARWKQAVRGLAHKKARRWIELVAAMIIGILIGSSLFQRPHHEENISDNATIQQVVTKIE